MPTDLNEHLEIPEPLLQVYQEMAISPVDLLRKYALDMIENKIRKYTAEELHYRNKYGCDLSSFQDKVAAMENEENFEWEEDLMDWEFVFKNLQIWHQKKQMITS